MTELTGQMCHSGMNIMWITNYFPIRLETCFTGDIYSCLVLWTWSKAWEVISSGEEAITLIFPNRHVVPMTLSSRHLCLCPKISAAASLDYRSFLFHCQWLLQRLRIGKTKSWEYVTMSHNAQPQMKHLYHPSWLGEHYRWGGRKNVRPRGRGRMLWNATLQAPWGHWTLELMTSVITWKIPAQAWDSQYSPRSKMWLMRPRSSLRTYRQLVVASR